MANMTHVAVQLLSCPALSNSMNCSMTGFTVLYNLQFVQVHVLWVNDVLQSCHPLQPSSPFVFNFSQHQNLFQRVSPSHQVAKVLELKL